MSKQSGTSGYRYSIESIIRRMNSIVYLRKRTLKVFVYSLVILLLNLENWRHCWKIFEFDSSACFTANVVSRSVAAAVVELSSFQLIDNNSVSEFLCVEPHTEEDYDVGYSSPVQHRPVRISNRPNEEAVAQDQSKRLGITRTSLRGIAEA